MKQSQLQALIKHHQLPETFKLTINEWYVPLAKSIAACVDDRDQANKTLVLGIQGAQGSGKSTLAHFLSTILNEQYSLQCAVLSLDDFYLHNYQRKQLAKTVHPLLQTRGVPGTHDVDLAIAIIDTLRQQTKNQSTRIPRFNKAIDDRFPENQWDIITGPVDIILLEGWCVGCTAQPENQLIEPINQLEKQEDSDGFWRTYVNNALQNDYQKLFRQMEKLIVLQAPSFECVFEWRWLQEQKLIEKSQQDPSKQSTQLLNKTDIKRFIAHYERLTRHCISALPSQADWVLTLDENHLITELISS